MRNGTKGRFFCPTLELLGQKNRPFVPLIGCDGDVDDVGAAFTVYKGLSLRNELNGLDVLDFPSLFNGAFYDGLV